MNEQIQSNNAASPDVLGDILGKILGSQTQGVGQIPQAQSATSSSDGGQVAGANSGNEFFGQGGDILSSLLSNSDLLLKLPSIISAAKPIIELFSQGQKANIEQKPTSDSVATNAPSVSASSASANQSHVTEHRSALLCAMKPYLGEERRQIIDYIVKLSRLGDILKTL